MIILLIYAIFLLLAVALAVMVFRRLIRRGLFVVLAASLVALSAFTLFLPIPIHGGFTFPLELLWGELQPERWRQGERRAEEKKRAFEKSSVERFAGVLTGYGLVNKRGGWQEVHLAQGGTAWLDLDSHLLWLAPQPLGNREASLDLEQAMAFCHRMAPKGYWALPTEGEMALLWRHGGHHLMPGTGHSGAALLLQGEYQLRLLTQYRGKTPGHALRCVALTATAPRGGYSASDIPLSLWNDYQLNKADIYRAGDGAGAIPFSQEMK